MRPRGVAVAVALLVGACGGGSDKSEPEGGAVTVKGFIFDPSPLTVKADTEVIWTNRDQILHTVTAGTTSGGDDANKTGLFDAPLDGVGKTFSHTFDEPGTYEYFCDRHHSMMGKVVVS
jgi:plastocyanin